MGFIEFFEAEEGGSDSNEFAPKYRLRKNLVDRGRPLDHKLGIIGKGHWMGDGPEPVNYNYKPASSQLTQHDNKFLAHDILKLMDRRTDLFPPGSEVDFNDAIQMINQHFPTASPDAIKVALFSLQRGGQGINGIEAPVFQHMLGGDGKHKLKMIAGTNDQEDKNAIPGRYKKINAKHGIGDSVDEKRLQGALAKAITTYKQVAGVAGPETIEKAVNGIEDAIDDILSQPASPELQDYARRNKEKVAHIKNLLSKD